MAFCLDFACRYCFGEPEVSTKSAEADEAALNSRTNNPSVDDAATHDRFAREHGLTFPLVADPDRKLARLYGATSALRYVLGVSARITYVIGKNGRVAMVHDDLDFSQHVAKTLAAVKALK